jgi:hypothetical protein
MWMKRSLSMTALRAFRKGVPPLRSALLFGEQKFIRGFDPPQPDAISPRLTDRSFKSRWALNCVWLRCECSGREFRFGNQNTVRTKEPVPYLFGLAKLDLRRVRRTSVIFSMDFKRALADFRFMPVLS